MHCNNMEKHLAACGYRFSENSHTGYSMTTRKRDVKAIFQRPRNICNSPGDFENWVNSVHQKKSLKVIFIQQGTRQKSEKKKISINTLLIPYHYEDGTTHSTKTVFKSLNTLWNLLSKPAKKSKSPK